jgi:DNA repair protein RadC
VKKSEVQKQIQAYGSEDAVIGAALEILRGRMSERRRLGNPAEVRAYLALSLQSLQYEVFWVVYVDSQNRVLAAEEAFRGTLAQTSVFPREIVKRALHHNAAAVIFAHNHPSGIAEPSRADEALTQTLKHTLAMVDVRVLDHFIIGEGVSMSFAERGLL